MDSIANNMMARKIFMWIVFYNLLTYVLGLPFMGLAFIFSARFRKNMLGRKGVTKRLQAYVNGLSKKERQSIILFHISSAGEFEQARPLIDALHARHKSLKIVVTFFSRSGINFIRSIQYQPVDYVDYLPFDFWGQMNSFLTILKPTSIVFVRYDLWPNLIYQAYDMGIKLYLIDACVHQKSMSTKWFISGFYSQILRKFNRIMAISEEDKSSLNTIFKLYDTKQVVVTGDTKYDRVMANLKKPFNKVKESYIFSDNRHYLVAGSTWLKDEQILCRVYSQLLKEYPSLQLILVPHEVSRTEEVRTTALQQGLSVKLLSDFNKKDELVIDNGVIIVNALGLLSDLYTVASFAYVGGAIDGRVHNVTEAAICSIPVFFGSSYLNSKEAIGLVQEKAVLVFRSEEEFFDLLYNCLKEPDYAKKLGKKAFDFIADRCGATQKSLPFIIRH